MNKRRVNVALWHRDEQLWHAFREKAYQKARFDCALKWFRQALQLEEEAKAAMTKVMTSLKDRGEARRETVAAINRPFREERDAAKGRRMLVVCLCKLIVQCSAGDESYSASPPDLAGRGRCAWP